MLPRLWRAFTRGPRPFLAALFVSSAIAAVCVRAVLARAGHPALPLDDAFIHAQYARRLAEGAFFSYVPGEGYTTGATSPLWPLLLAPFHAIGFRDLSIVWPMWAIGTLAHAGVAVETGRLAYRLAGRAAALGAAGMCLAFGAFAWFAWSGMETVLFAWVLLRTARAASEWCEAGRGPRGRGWRAAAALVSLGIAAPLVRPEGLLASLTAAFALAVFPVGRARLLALAPLAGPAIVPALNLVLAGHAASSTTQVKWLPGNPYHRGGALAAAIADNAHRLFASLLDGGPWTHIFLPEGARLPIVLGAVALLYAARRRRAPFRAAFVAAVALGTLLPCTYLSFLWNRVRYIWPFAGAWFVLAACLARELGDIGRRLHPRLAWLTPALLAGAVAALGAKLPLAIADLAQSAHAIDRQQVALGRWAHQNLPAGARIGVNDTGAIAYLGGRPTFDVVGLTTEGEARYWVAGAGSRYEHYESMPRERLPTHFIVYPQWMACPPVLGDEIFEATVLDQSILGGVTMVVYEASWGTLRSGEEPGDPRGRRVDALDVADLESEAAHRFELGATSDTENVAVLDLAPEPGRGAISDGGRAGRVVDRFTLRLPQDRPSRLTMRLSAELPTRVAITVGGRDAGVVEVPAGPWVEREVELPAGPGGEAAIAIAAPLEAPFASFHYWIHEP